MTQKFLPVYPREMKTDVHTTPCTQMFISAALVTAKDGEQPQYPITAEWMNK